MANRFSIWLLLLVTVTVAAPALAQFEVQAVRDIPALAWVPRSDWINVKTSVPAAKGDGVTDDTAAIQAALNQLGDSIFAPKVVYFPAGNYRITSTLSVTQIHGGLLVGRGQSTRIFWDGPAGGRMFWSNGFTYSRFVGLKWDGMGVAAVGVDHDSKGFYETRVRHQHEAFLNFTAAGIRVGNDQYNASAEMYYDNCLFKNCGSGAAFLQFNDYDNTFSGCEFYDCGTAINSQNGNVYVRDCHFERSTVTDVQLNPHSHSVRRCTSLGSRRFINTYGTSTNSCEITVQDCRVSGWTDPTAAIYTMHRGPVTIFDCAFSNPPNTNPPVYFANGNWVLQAAILSNNATRGTYGLWRGDAAIITRIPAGSRGPSIFSAQTRFLKTVVAVPGQVFDAKRDFGAKGDNVADDTAALAATIAAARAAGNGAIAYLPSGRYRISSTLDVTGSDYYIGGTGWLSMLEWVGDPNGVMMTVRNPQNLVLEHFSLNSQYATVTRLRQTGTGPSTIKYDGLYTWGYNPPSGLPDLQGLQLLNLPAGSVVLGDHVDGHIDVINSSAATILFNVSYDGVVSVEGRTSPRTGFMGMQTRVSALDAWPLVVRDNQNLVIGDYYNEQTDHFVWLEGGGTQRGRVSIKGVKMHSWTPEAVTINRYAGRVAFMGGHFVYDPARVITVVGPQYLDLVLLGNSFWKELPVIGHGAQTRRIVVGNLLLQTADSRALVPNRAPVGWQGVAAEVLDDFRELGRMDLLLNWGV